jgi:Uma2 family endonuclease
VTVHLIEGSDGLARRAFSAVDLRRMIDAGIMDEGEPFELVEGELVFMNAQGFAHDIIKTALARKLGRFLSESFFVGAEVSVQLTGTSIVQPDLVVAPRQAIACTDEGFLTIEASAILLLVEVAATSLSFDRGRKARLYAREGIAEYWVIDANKRRGWLYGGPSEEGFKDVKPVLAEDEIRPSAPELAGFSIRIDDLS